MKKATINKTKTSKKSHRYTFSWRIFLCDKVARGENKDIGNRFAFFSSKQDIFPRKRQIKKPMKIEIEKGMLFQIFN